MCLGLTVRARVGRKRVLVIPKSLSALTLTRVLSFKLTAFKDRIVIEPLRDAVWLSLHGEKVAYVTLEELEEESLEQQERCIEG